MPIQTFLEKVETLIQTGVATEHSYRSALENLFHSLKTGISVINEPARATYGAIDLRIDYQNIPIGYLEAKDIKIRIDKAVLDSEQIKPRTEEGRQLRRYRAALPNLIYSNGLTWYWFSHNKDSVEPVTIAKLNSTANSLIPSDTGIAKLHTLLEQFLNNVDLKSSITPKDLAQRLAQITHWLRDTIITIFSNQSLKGELHQQLDAFRKTLLPELTSDEFADMYAQTIVYGLFAARVATPSSVNFTRFHAAQAIPKANPFLRSMFYQIAGQDLPSSVLWLVDRCASLLNNTDMDYVMQDFGRTTRREDPVVHFYETFLQSYDPKLRNTRGVYYTPEPVVNFIVKAVHLILQTEFSRPLGLADDSTIVLDPATGTATFLNSVVQQIYQELVDQGLNGLWNSYVPSKLFPRIFGFELLMAPYTIAHLKLGLLISELGYDFQDDQRLGIYLTNTLADAPTPQTAFAFANKIAQEGEAANDIKHHKKVMVVLGNPPYSGHSTNHSPWIQDLLHGKHPSGRSTESFYLVDGKGLKERNTKWLQDDYVKFIRFGEWRISESGEGILAYITNNGYLDNPTFRGMRESLLKDFDTIYIINLHGNSNKKEKTPDGHIDENVFDIQQGVAIGIFIKTLHSNQAMARVYYTDLWGKRDNKYQALSNNNLDSIPWKELNPRTPRYLFIPLNETLINEYEEFPSITEIFNQESGIGIVTHNDDLFLGYTQAQVQDKFTLLEDTTVTDDVIYSRLGLANGKYWNMVRERQKIREYPWREYTVQYTYRPFDTRWINYQPNIMEIGRGGASKPIMRHIVHKNNLSILTTRQTREPFGAMVTRYPCSHKSLSAYDGTYVFPLYLYHDLNQESPSFFDNSFSEHYYPNLNPSIIKDLERKLGLTWMENKQGDLITTFGPEDILHYVYAILSSPTYRERYNEFLQIDFPRIPIASNLDLFITLSKLGAELIDYHLLQLPKTQGIGGYGGSVKLQKIGLQGIAFPINGNNVVEFVKYVPSNNDANGEVQINTQQKFIGINQETWDTQVGGYQPLKKWLQDRKASTLSTDDVLHYMRMVIALKETHRIMNEIDAAIPSWPIS